MSSPAFRLRNNASAYTAFRRTGRRAGRNWRKRRSAKQHQKSMKSTFPIDEFTKNMIARHFKRPWQEFTEKKFIEIIENPKSSKHDIYWAVLGLRDVGTRNSVPALKRLKNYPMQDVKDCSLLTIAHLVEHEATSFYAEVLVQKGTKKGYPMWAIRVSGDERAIDAVLEYLQEVYKKWKYPKSQYTKWAFLDGLIYLDKYFNRDDRINKLFAHIAGISHKFSSDERKRIEKETNNLWRVLHSKRAKAAIRE